MSKGPLVSIVLPTHDGSRYLERAIESCTRQTLGDLELIVVDDGSLDDTPGIVERSAASDPRIVLLRHATNRGLPAALNTGFARARGRYLTWTSDDNLYRPTAISEMARFLDENPGVGLVYCDYTKIDEEDRVIGGVVAGPPRKLAYYCVVGACFLYRREVGDALGTYDENLFCAEDYEYWLRLARRFSIAPLHRDLYLYRWHAASLTSARRDRVDRKTEAALRRHLPHLKPWNRRALARGHLALASYSWRRNDRKTAVADTLRALRTSPLHAIHHLVRRSIRKKRPAGV